MSGFNRFGAPPISRGHREDCERTALRIMPSRMDEPRTGMPVIDLNCDLGEGAGHDAELMPLITSANIACGGHAGDAATMRASVELARRHGVAVGAHPGFADREHFGRRELPATPRQVHKLVAGQVRVLQEIARSAGVGLAHVKPHGALYNLAARDDGTARAVVEAVCEFDPGLVLFGLAGSRLLEAGRACGLRVAGEVFADRTYQRDGSLTSRGRPDALVAGAEEAVAQVLRIIREGWLRAADGSRVDVEADTVCIHGDGPRAVEFARALRSELARAGVELRAPR